MKMRDLARLANVSVSTVSKAFRDAPDVSKETKELIISIAKENGCYGKYKKERFNKKVIGIICQEVQSNYYSTFVELLQKLIEANGGLAVVSTYQFDPAKQRELIDYYCSYIQVDGIFVFGLRNELKVGYDIPIVSIFSAIGGPVDEITVDFNEALHQSVKLLYELGHRKIAFFGEPLTQYKAHIFLESIARYPDCAYEVFQSDHRFEQAGEDCALRMLRNAPDCTAAICGYDNIAIGAMKTLQRKGIAIPSDFSVIGVDNLQIGQYTHPALTSIASPPDEICRIAWDLMEKKLNNPYYKSYQQILIQNQLILRDSVAKAKCKA